MLYASDFRARARDALSGRWGMAVLAALIASLLGGIASDGFEFTFNIDAGNANVSVELAGQPIYTTGQGIDPRLADFLVGGIFYLLSAVLVVGVIFFFLGSVVNLGYSKYNLELLDRRQEPKLGILFDYFTYWKTAAAAMFLKGLYVLLWTLLFVIPGIIAAYNYAMTSYILADNPELSASEAIQSSQNMMYGNRWRLFCLQWSFFGWDILCVLTLGIGHLWLTPYKQAATAAFYREISGTTPMGFSEETQ